MTKYKSKHGDYEIETGVIELPDELARKIQAMTEQADHEVFNMGLERIETRRRLSDGVVFAIFEQRKRSNQIEDDGTSTPTRDVYCLRANEDGTLDPGASIASQGCSHRLK